MFDKQLIPAENNQFKQLLNNLYNGSGAIADVKSIIDKKLDKINQTIKEKIINTVTISNYFDELWQQPELRPQDKDFVIRKLETIQQNKKNSIVSGEQFVSKSVGNLDVINSSFKMTPFEEFQLQEKVKEVRKTKKLEIETPLLSNLKEDLDVLHAINRPFRSVQNSRVRGIHYTGGLCDGSDDDLTKKQKAEEFVKKIKEDKREFVKKIKRQEKSVEERDNLILERLLQKAQTEEALKHQEKKKRLEEHIKELKTRSEVRAKENARWEEEYKSHLSKKPLYKEIENKYKKGFIIPELEERKKKLQELRDFHKPLDMKEILEHERKVTRILEENQTKKKKEDEKNTWEYKKPSFESMHHKVFAEELSKARNQKEHQEIEKLKRKERVMELLQEVKEKHAPRTDPNKELERLEIIEKLRSKNHKEKSMLDSEDRSEEVRNVKKIGDDYLKAVKDLVRSKGVLRTPSGMGQTAEKREREFSDPKKITTNSVQSEPAKKRDYLSELRKENKIVDRSNRVDLLIKKKDLDDSTKQVLLQDEVSKMEEKVKRKEIVRKFKKPKNLEEVIEDEEFDKLYVNTIKAKLEMLSHL